MALVKTIKRSELTGHTYVPPEGSQNYVLAKASSIDADLEWVDVNDKLTGPGIGAALFPLTDAEQDAGLNNSDVDRRIPSHDAVGVILLARYGLSESANGSTNVGAIDSAISVAEQLGGGVLRAHPGVFALASTVTVAVNFVVIEGSTISATFWRFDPASTDICFHFTKGASSIVRSGIRNCSFVSSNTTTKTAVKFDDGRQCFFESIGVSSGSWPGSGSIGLHTSGRDFFRFKHCDIECARPWLISDGPNLSGANEITMDMTKVTQVQFATTEATGKCVEVETGAILYSTEFDTCDFAGGKYGFYFDDTTAASDSLHLGFRNCRFEQSDDPTGFDIYVASTSANLANLHIEKVNSDGARGFLYGRNLERISLFNSIIAGGSGITNFDVTFITSTVLELVATLVQASSTNTLTNAVIVSGSPFSTAANALPQTALYRYNEAAVVSERPARGYNDKRIWSYTGTLANNGTINTPITRATHTACVVSVVAYSATGPVKAGGSAVWFTDGTTTKIGGTANFVVVAAGAEIRCLDGGSGLVVINTLGQTVTIMIDIDAVA